MGDHRNDSQGRAAESDDNNTDEPNVLIELNEHGMGVLSVVPDEPVLLDFPHQFVYERSGDLLRFRSRGLTNHEVRAIMIGLWSLLDQADKEDVILELTAYLDPKETPSAISRTIRDALSKEDMGGQQED